MGEIHGHVMIWFMYSVFNYPRHYWLYHTAPDSLGHRLNNGSIFFFFFLDGHPLSFQYMTSIYQEMGNKNIMFQKE